MIPIAIFFGVLIIMACRQTQVVSPVIHDDPEVPLPPASGGGDANPPVLTDATVRPSPRAPGVVYDDNGNPIGTTGTEYPPAYEDPSVPVPVRVEEPFDEGPIGTVLTDDPWAMDPVYVPPAPELPVKIDPVADQPPVYFDPQLPVPSEQERIDAQIDPGVDSSLPVPTPESDPVLYASDPWIEVPPAENPMDNWTAETVEETECPPSVEVEDSWMA